MSKSKILSGLPLKHPSVHCIGIGGVGVSAIAELLLECGCKVSGSDREINDSCRHLSGLGAVIAPAGHREENLPSEPCGGVIMTAAANFNNPEAAAMLRRGVMLWKRGEFLGELARVYDRPVMVAGSHGKSSTSAMLGWIMYKLNIDSGLLLGAKYNGNYRSARAGSGDILVAEADESDNLLPLLAGEVALISNIDGDHAWSDQERARQESDFRRFACQFKKTIYIESEKTNELFGRQANCTALGKKELSGLDALLPARFAGYERLNAALAVAGAAALQIDVHAAAAALEDYPGIGRRQSQVWQSPDGKISVLEDYAHHPTELAASLAVIKSRYRNCRILVVIQPHRYRRLRCFFREFSSVLSDPALTVKVLPVFSAWEDAPVDALENSDLALSIQRNGGNAEAVDNNFAVLAGKLAAWCRENASGAVAALIGAGDISDLTPELIKALELTVKK